MSQEPTKQTAVEHDARSPIDRLIDSFNPGITLLVLVWVVGLSARRYLIERDLLEGFADRGLTSLMFVVPLMLVGWAVLTLAERLIRDDD